MRNRKNPKKHPLCSRCNKVPAPSVSRVCEKCSDEKAAEALERLRNFSSQRERLGLNIKHGCPLCGTISERGAEFCPECFEKVLGHEDGLEHMQYGHAGREYKKDVQEHLAELRIKEMGGEPTKEG